MQSVNLIITHTMMLCNVDHRYTIIINVQCRMHNTFFLLSFLFINILFQILARASELQAPLFRWSTGNNISGHYFRLYLFFIYFFSCFFSVVYFSHRRSARIKKLILQKWLEMANDLGLDPFPDYVGRFGAPWRPFWILQVVLCFS